MKNVKISFEKIEVLLRLGKINEATKLFETFDLSLLKREERLLAANICRRIFKINLGLKLLHPLIFSEHLKPKETELTEYAILLTLNGSIREAKKIIETIEKIESAKTLLAKVWIHFGMWEFQKAISILEAYIDKEDDYYYKLAGKINLAEAYLELEDLSHCEMIIGSVIKELSKTQFNRLLANALHIQAMLFYSKGNIAQSQKIVKRGLLLFGEGYTSDKILFYRQRAINESFQSKKMKAIYDFKKMAKKDQAWDSLRKVDIESLKIKFNHKLFLKVYFGTPYANFRFYLDKLFPGIEKPNSLKWGNQKAATLYLKTGKCSSDEKIKLSGISLRIIELFLRDLYSPLKVGDIFAGLYPDEHFHFLHSPNRIKQAIHRLRKEIKASGIRLSIKNSNGYYYLEIDQNYSITRDFEDLQIINSQDPKFEKLKKLKYFSRKKVMEVLNLSKATSNRLLGRYVAEGKIKLEGAGNKTKYRCKI